MNAPPTQLVGLHLNTCASSTFSAACSGERFSPKESSQQADFSLEKEKARPNEAEPSIPTCCLPGSYVDQVADRRGQFAKGLKLTETRSVTEAFSDLHFKCAAPLYSQPIFR
jgi:hypothetical protein